MLYDSADLVLRCRDAAQLPDDDEAMTAAAWYRLLTEAQAVWYPQVAAHVPTVLYGVPELLESTDGGVTYPFGDDEDGRPIMPLGEVWVFRTEADAYEPDAYDRRLRNGVDFQVDASQLRFRLTSPTPFDDGGPWVRMIEPPGVIDATHEPVLQPVHARQLLVYGAVETWATQGGLRDPSPWVGRAQKLWAGDPASRADVGLLGALKQQFSAPPPRGRGVSGRVPFWAARGWR